MLVLPSGSFQICSETNTNLTLLRALTIINMHLGAFTFTITRLKVNLHQAIFMCLSISVLF